MKRTSKVGVVALAALALAGVLGASSASAAKFVSETEFTKFNSSSASMQIAFGPGGTVFSCSGPTFAGTALGKKFSGTGTSISSLTTTENGTPSCTSSTMNWNKCQLILHPPTSGISSDGSVEIGPANCGPVVFKYGVMNCEWTIPPQTGIETSYENVGSGTGRKINVHISTNTLKYTNLGTGPCGSKGSFSGGSWAADLTLEGTDSGGSPSGMHVAQLPVGVFMAGEKSEEAGKQPRFEAEEYPTDLVGQVSKEHRFTPKAGGSVIGCGSGTLGSALTGASTTLDVDADYASCSFISPTDVIMNSCSYVFQVANAGPPYSGTAEVECATPGDTIEFITNPSNPICIYEFPEQKLGTATYSTVGGLNTRSVKAEVEATGLTYVRTYNGFFCPVGSSTGTFSGGFTLGGVE